ncbi:MAG: hypothetical protein IKU86_06950 [Thermoguttaceae bacterium]|nr:hypothetical protein [Thermoguttaceae bacterium]
MTTNKTERTNAPASENRRFPTAEAATSSVFFLALWLFWGVRYGDFLFAVQENSLFLFRSDFFARWQEAPGGLLFYLTAFFIQFCYFPLLGGAILAAFGTILQILTAKAAGLRGVGYAFSLIPPCLLAISATWSGYCVYIPFNNSLVFSGYLGASLALVALLAFRRIASPRLRLAFGLGVVALGYPGFGFWAPFAGLLCAFDELERWNAPILSKKRANGETLSSPTAAEIDAERFARSLRIVALFLGAIVIPFAFYHVFFCSRVKFCNVFWQGLIEDVRYDKKGILGTFVYGFAALTPVFYVVARPAALWNARRAASRSTKIARNGESNKRGSVGKTGDSNVGEREERSRRGRLLAATVVLIGLATFALSYRATCFFAVLKANRALADGDWARILEIESKIAKPNDQCVALRNLALFETGALAEKAFERPIAGILTYDVTLADYEALTRGSSWAKFKFWLNEKKIVAEKVAPRALSELIFCYYGNTNVAARIATDNFVASEGRAVSFYKTLAVGAIVNGEDKIARRYLNELEQTLFYRDWARARLAFLDSPEFRNDIRYFGNDAEYLASAKKRFEEAAPKAASLDEAAKRWNVAPEAVANVAEKVKKARGLRARRNEATLSTYPNLTFLLGVFKDEYDEAAPETQELLLIAALLKKDGDYFLKHVEKYLATRPNGKAPKAIEQGLAAWRWTKFGADWQTAEGRAYPFSPDTVAELNGFAEFVKMVKTPSAPQAQEAIREHCAGLYWGYLADESVFGGN